MTHFWLREEERSSERRTTIVPADARRVIEAGHRLSVETSTKRVFPDADYVAAGAEITPAGSWRAAPKDAVIIGVKELPDRPEALSGQFVHFAHIYKGQSGWQQQLARFVAGGGTLYDIEYLVNEAGQRIASFSWWAGYIGAAVGLGRLLDRRLGLDGAAAGLSAFADRAAVESDLRAKMNAFPGPLPQILVVGAKGRSGRGALACLQAIGVTITGWDKEETRPLNRYGLMSHDMLVNCVLVNGPGLTLATRAELERPSTRLRVIADVACDPLSPFNPLPVYEQPTSWDAPFLTVAKADLPNAVELLAIDNLPALLPKDASEGFSKDFSASLLRFPDGHEWRQSLKAFEAARRRAEV